MGVWGIAVWRGLVAWVSVKRAVWQQEFNPILGRGDEICLSPSEYALPFGGLCPVEVFDSPLTTVTPAATRTSARHRAAATMLSLQRLADRFGDGFNRRCGTSDRAQAQHYSHQRLRPPPHPGINEPAQTDRHSSMAPGFASSMVRLARGVMRRASEKVLHRKRQCAVVFFVAKVTPVADRAGPMRGELLVQRGFSALPAQIGAVFPGLPNLARDGPAV